MIKLFLVLFISLTVNVAASGSDFLVDMQNLTHEGLAEKYEVSDGEYPGSKIYRLRQVPPTLDEAKAIKKSEIDATTNFIRDRDGLSYASERFAMTEGAKLNWTGLLAANAILPLPMNILTIDDKPFQLADKNELMAFLMAVMNYDTAEGSPITSGRMLRMQVEAATTVAEVEAITDGRQ